VERYTGEFGPRGGLGDLEYHTQVATRFGISACTAREGRYSPVDQAPAATQIKLADGVNPFETGALADTVTVKTLTYRNAAIDAGFKYRGFSFQSEYTIRKLSNFDAAGPVPESSLLDHGFFVQGMHMVVPKRLGLYAMGSYIMDAWKRHPSEAAGSASLLPVRESQLAFEPELDPRHQVPGQLQLRLLRRRTDRHHDFDHGGHPAMTACGG
jgi:hypothetical protein